MAEPINLASGLLAFATLATLALQSTLSLYDLVKSFRSPPRRVRDLLQDLEALTITLSTKLYHEGQQTSRPRP
ncbi:hypothetical protein BJX65DRAFT_264772 [Aspergillus insuetus]